ncbi:MAG TPA: DUF5367 family protein [Candidatus Acidoferrales bacterium]|nr:DUF5367 family protein [Candidatus Acidoferrales bacterium]
MRRALVYGFALWAIGTVGLRLAGGRLLLPHQPARTISLYAASFALMAWVIPRICLGLRLERGLWFQAAALLMLPTFLLDPFSAAFFPSVFPNIDAGAAGVFGGWLLMCCAGIVAGVWIATTRDLRADAPAAK